MALDAKALALLYGSDEKLRELLNRGLLESRDEEVKRVLSLLQSRARPDQGGAVAMAVAEMVLAAFLALLGIVAFIPNLIGLDTPQALLSYLTGLISSVGSGPLFSFAVAVEFGFAVLLMLGSFYSLRLASANLKRAGLR